MGCALACGLAHPWKDINYGNQDLDSHNGTGSWRVSSLCRVVSKCLLAEVRYTCFCFLHMPQSPTRLEPQVDGGGWAQASCSIRGGTLRALECPPWREQAPGLILMVSLAWGTVPEHLGEFCASYLRVLCDSFSSPRLFLLMATGTHWARTCIRACFHFPC